MLVPVQKLAKRHIERAIADTELRAKVTPRWRIGCKRMLMSNTYYPALAQPHVDVVTDGIAAVRPNAIVSTDGSVREVDASSLPPASMSPTHRPTSASSAAAATASPTPGNGPARRPTRGRPCTVSPTCLS
jgi:Predicted flavoprotein involved in K+ transport